MSIEETQAKTQRCDDCGNMIRVVEIVIDHDPGCVVRMKDPQTDQERAQQLANEYEQQKHDPRAKELARLLRSVK